MSEAAVSPSAIAVPDIGAFFGVSKTRCNDAHAYFAR